MAKLPTRTYLWGVLGVLIACIHGGFGAALAAYTMLRQSAIASGCIANEA